LLIKIYPKRSKQYHHTQEVPFFLSNGTFVDFFFENGYGKYLKRINNYQTFMTPPSIISFFKR